WVDTNESKIFSRDRVLVRAAQEAQSISLDQLIDRARIDTELSLILLNGVRVLFPSKDQLLFTLPLGLHLIGRHGGGSEDGSSGCEKNQRCKRKSSISSTFFHAYFNNGSVCRRLVSRSSTST